ncbi:hypothetical protein Q1695_003532 [Nippostrongylus brasiliensis]|nr:hypothetical protein Q1695_003532 [Nippostrongylus brasiliensis]
MSGDGVDDQGIVLDLNANYNEDVKESQLPTDDLDVVIDEPDPVDDDALENGTDETAKVDDNELDGDDRAKTPDAAVPFSAEPADKVPASQDYGSFQFTDSDTEGLGLKKPDFEIPIQKKSRKSKTSTRQSSRQKTDDSKRERDRSKTRQKETCKCQQIRDDPKLKTKACTIL